MPAPSSARASLVALALLVSPLAVVAQEEAPAAPLPLAPVDPLPPEPAVPEPAPAPEPAPTPPTAIATYDDILAAADAETGPGAPYAVRLEAVWAKLKPFAAPESPAPKEAKIDALDRFLRDFPDDNRHDVYAEKMRYASEIGATKVNVGGRRNFGGPFTAEELRRRWELFQLTIGPGVFKSTLSISFFTLRWSHFYWEIVRGSFLFPGVAANGTGGHGGTGVGIPFHRGDDGRREIRLGLGLEAGALDCWLWNSDTHRQVFGPFILPELSFHRRNAHGVAFVTTIRVELGPVGDKHKWIEDDPETEEDEAGLKISYYFYANAALLLGVAY